MHEPFQFSQVQRSKTYVQLQVTMTKGELTVLRPPDGGCLRDVLFVLLAVLEQFEVIVPEFGHFRVKFTLAAVFAAVQLGLVHLQILRPVEVLLVVHAAVAGQVPIVLFDRYDLVHQNFVAGAIVYLEIHNSVMVAFLVFSRCVGVYVSF